MKKYQYTVYDIFQVVMQTFIRHDNKYEKVEAQIKYMHTQSQSGINKLIRGGWV
jgi:hypothetical protein